MIYATIDKKSLSMILVIIDKAQINIKSSRTEYSQMESGLVAIITINANTKIMYKIFVTSLNE